LILAAQSAVYSPAKYSIIKSIVGTENIGMANGVIQALTIVAIPSVNVTKRAYGYCGCRKIESRCERSLQT
jgi:hypothetical protein